MGYPLQPNAPKCTTQGRTFAVGAFDWSTPMGAFYKVGVYEQLPTGEWNELSAIATYTNAGEVLADIKAKGGGVKYIQWLVAKVNAFFVALFGAPVAVVIAEPVTDQEAKAYIASSVAGLQLTVTNGVPVLA